MDIMDKLRAKQIGEPVKVYSEALEEDLYFKPLTTSRNQTYSLMGAQLAQSILTKEINEDTFSENVFFLVRWTWVNEDGSFVLDSKERYDEFKSDVFAPAVVENIILLAVNAHKKVMTSEKKTTTKKKGLAGSRKKRGG